MIGATSLVNAGLAAPGAGPCPRSNAFGTEVADAARTAATIVARVGLIIEILVQPCPGADRQPPAAIHFSPAPPSVRFRPSGNVNSRPLPFVEPSLAG